MASIFAQLQVLSLVVLVAACAPKKGYDGPELPADQVVTVSQESAHGVESFPVSVNNQTWGCCGLTLLPGAMQVLARPQIKAPGGYSYCSGSTSVRYSDFSECKKKNPGTCSECNYTTISENCSYDVLNMECPGTFKGKAGVTYRFVPDVERTVVMVKEKDTQRIIKTFPCTKVDTYSKNYQGIVSSSASSMGYVTLSDGSKYWHSCDASMH